MESLSEFWAFIIIFVVAGFAYMFGANKMIEKIMKMLKRGNKNADSN